MNKNYYVYMMANTHNTTLYIGVTNNLCRRVFEHKSNQISGFTKKYNCHKLVWYLQTDNVESAITKEKQMKKWKREYKENVINAMNSDWIDLYDELCS